MTLAANSIMMWELGDSTIPSASDLAAVTGNLSIAGGVHSAQFGSGPVFTVPAHNFAGLRLLPLFAVLGLFCALLAVVVTEGLFLVESLYRRLPVGEFWYPVIGAIGFATTHDLALTALWLRAQSRIKMSDTQSAINDLERIVSEAPLKDGRRNDAKKLLDELYAKPNELIAPRGF